MSENNNYRPIFGTYCRTCEFEPEALEQIGKQFQNREFNIRHYAEAFQDDDVKGTWAVQIVHKTMATQEIGTEKRDVKAIRTELIANGTSFSNALRKLANIEAMAMSPLTPHKIVGQSKEELANNHYYHFGIREGFLFDIRGHLKKRPNEYALPANATFNQSELDEANQIWDNTKDERKNPAPMPITHDSLLSEIFMRAASKGNPQDALLNAEVIGYLDEFYAKMKSVKKNLDTYVEGYRELGKFHLLENSFIAIKESENVLKNIASHEIETDAFELFLGQLQIYTFMTHAQALYTLNIDQVFEQDNYEQKAPSVDKQRKANEKSMKSSLKEAVKMAKNFGASTEEIQLLQSSYQTTPKVPQSLINYIGHYQDKRDEFMKQMKAGNKVSVNHMAPPGVG